MSLGLPVPTNFVLPTEFFDFNSGLTTAELEFPAYFNYFVLKKRVTIITTQEGLKYLEVHHHHHHTRAPQPCARARTAYGYT